MKNKIIIAVCVLIMIVPTILAIACYKAPQKEIVKDPEGVSRVIITDSNANTFTVEDKDGIKLLTDLANGTPVSPSSVPTEVLTDFKTFAMSYVRGDTVAVYYFYMSAQRPDQVYFKDENDNYYSVNDNLTIRGFMETQYAVSLYDTTVPVLTVGDNGTVISPAEIKWNYSTVEGNYTPVSVPTVTEVANVDKISKKTLGINFSRKPDNAVISVFDGGETVFSKLLEDFVGIPTKEAKYYKIQIHAKWNEAEGQKSYGEAMYQFNAYIMPDAEFSFSATDMQQGSFIAITVKNASAQGLVVECTPELKALPEFYDDGANAVAFLATSYETEPGEYQLKLTYDGVVYDQTITVREPEKEYSKKEYKNPASEINSVFSAENLAAEEDIREKVFTSQSASGLLCAGERTLMPTSKDDHKTGYGIYVSFKETDGEARHDGIDFDVKKGSDVKAVLSGTVVYAGVMPIHGGTIVIDHGNGVRSWYSRVDTSGVSEGQTVARGDVIAKSDDSGFGDSSRVHFGFSVGRTFVNSRWILEKELPH